MLDIIGIKSYLSASLIFFLLLSSYKKQNSVNFMINKIENPDLLKEGFSPSL